MFKRKKSIYILGSIAIGIVAILSVLFLLISLDVIKTRLTDIVITSASAEKVYDGQTLKCEKYEITGGKLNGGDEPVIVYTGSQTTAGQSENTFTVMIVDTEGADVTSNYKITCSYGTLSVTKRPLILTASSAIKNYDGTELTLDDYSVTSGKLVDGHELSVSVSGSITDAGSELNKLTASVLDGNQMDVTSNYNIEIRDGNLIVNPVDLTIRTGSAERFFNGEALTCEEYELVFGSLVMNDYLSVSFDCSITNAGSVENIVAVRVFNEFGLDVTDNYRINVIEGTLTIHKAKINISSGSSTKEYDGVELTNTDLFINTEAILENQEIKAETLGKITDVGEVQNDIFAQVVDLNGNDVSSNYTFEYTPGKLVILGRKISIQTETMTKEYDGQPLIATTYSIKTGSLVDGDYIDASVKGEITDVGNTYSDFESFGIYNSLGEDNSKNYTVTITAGILTITKREIVVTTGSLSVIYDELPHREETYALSGGKLVDGHNLEVLYLNSRTDVGTIVNSASVKVLNSQDDVSRNYDVHVIEGSITILPREIFIKTRSAKKSFDGNSFSFKEYDIVGELVSSHTFKVEDSSWSSAIFVGEYDNTVLGQVYDSNNQNVSSNYKITYVNGTLIIEKKQITLKTSSLSVVYDGTPKKADSFSLIQGNLVNGHTVNAAGYEEFTDAGDYENLCTFAITDGVSDYTNQYLITTNWGSISIDKINIILRSEGAQKLYDGTPLTNNTWNISYGVPAPGHTVYCDVLGSQTEAGESYNTIYGYVLDSNGQNVSRNYVFTYNQGILKVFLEAVYLSPVKVASVYTGEEISAVNELMGFESLAQKGYTYKTTVEGSRTEPGITKSRVTSINIYRNDVDVTSAFYIVCTTGEVQVYEFSILVVTDSLTKEYDATALEGTGYSYSGNVSTDHRVEVTFTGSQTEVGSSLNTVTISIYNEFDEDITDLYYITKSLGTLKVTKRDVTFECPTKIGFLVTGGLTVDSSEIICTGLLAGHTASYDIEGATLNEVGFVTVTLSNIIIYDQDGNDITDYYSVTVIDGELVIVE